MKPAFALDFRNDAIALLHRAAGGWHQVGRVTFDEPDLPSALGYLRATALGLSPRGLATKLILPDDQILLTVVEAPGPDDASRAAQIRAGLEGRTPYPVEDLVFDWEIVGGEVRVAVVARDTLAEAEAFAVEHRFNPVAFVGAPASGFAAEPWFGPTVHAAEVLAAGEVLERDDTQVTVLARGFDEGAEAEPEPAPLPETKPEPQPQPEPAPLPEMPEAEPDLPEPEPEPDLPAPEETSPEELAHEEPAPEEPAPDEPDWPEAAPDEVAAEPVHDLPADLPPEPYAPPLREPREAPVFGLADDEPAPSEVFRARPADYLPPAFDPVFDPVDDLPDDLAATLRDIARDDEAPMAVDVEDDLPGGDMGGDMGADMVAADPAGPRITDPAIQDDVPPVPGYSPAMSFASRRASVTEGGAPKLAAPPPRPAVARPAGAKPLPPAAPKPERPMVDRPTAVNLAPQREKPRENKGLRGLGALVTAPGLPGSRKKVMIPTPSPAVASPLEVNPGASAATLSPAAPAAAEVEARRPATAQNAKGPANHGLGTGRPATRGKPRYLGLILTAVLLIVLAVIAAWSTSLAFRSQDGAEVQQAAADTEVPAPEDEMAADGELPEAEAAPESAAESAQIATPAPVDTSEAAAAEVEGLDGAPAPGSATAGDEIVLATSDSLPDTPAPVDLPEATAQGDPMPLAQAPPPPFGTVYQFDANGLIVPTPEGIITPEGVRLVAGKPPRVPQPRPEGLAPAVPEIAPEIAPEAAAEAVAVDAETLAPAATFQADPAMAKFRPKTRPEGLVPPVQLNEATAPESGTDTAADATSSDNRLASLRPKARPGAVLAAGEAALAAKAASAASLTAQAETAAAANSGSPLAVAISRRPAARPQDLSRAVEAAVAAAVRTPEPQPEPEPEPAPTQTASLVAKAAPKAKPEPEPEPQPTKKAKSTLSGRDKNSEAEADDEPELEAAPKSKSGGSVAKQATFKNALAMDKTSLIGVYGTPSNRYAMIRTSNGRYKKVKIGDSVDGGRVQAITATEVRYQKGSRLVTLALPRG